MVDLVNAVLQAHGGIRRWEELKEVRAKIVTGGDLWGMKGIAQDAQPREMTVLLHQQRASVQPYGSPDQRTSFSPHRIAVEKLDGAVVSEAADPRSSFDGHGVDTPWNALHRAYFNGYAMWNYLTMPFFMTFPGVAAREIHPVREGDEMWRRLRVTFPPSMATHSAEQEFCFGDDFMLRRHDYCVDVAGGLRAAQYVSAYTTVAGIRLPTVRRAYRRGPTGQADLNQLLVSIDISDVRFT